MIIVDFEPQHAEAFKQLNVEWITRYWQMEAADEAVLNHPRDYIINKGGAIFMALQDDRPVGSVALIPYNPGILELAKMAVSPACHGQGIGLALAEHALQQAKTMGATAVYLESNTRLRPALSLYRKLGFIELSEIHKPSAYARCNIRMQVQLN